MNQPGFFTSNTGTELRASIFDATEPGMAFNILSIRPIKETSGIGGEDVTWRLMGYGFHASTMNFPVAGTLMVEPTESESLDELNRFIDAIREEIARVERGERDREDNVLKNALHTAAMLLAADWQHDTCASKLSIRWHRCARASTGRRWRVWTLRMAIGT